MPAFASSRAYQLAQALHYARAMVEKGTWRSANLLLGDNVNRKICKLLDESDFLVTDDDRRFLCGIDTQVTGAPNFYRLTYWPANGGDGKVYLESKG